MGNNITPDNLRGFLIPIKNLDQNNLWASQSSYTQMNSRAGVPVPQQYGTNLIVGAIGEQTNQITLQTQNGGTAGESASLLWQDHNSVVYGRDWKNIITNWDYWKYSSSTAAGTYFDSDCISNYLGDLFVISEVLDSSNRYTVSLRKQTRDGAITLVETFYSEILPYTPRNNANPTILELGDGSLIVAYCNYTNQDQQNIVVSRSIDGGLTWTQQTTRGLYDSLDSSTGSNGYVVGKMKLTLSNDVVSLWVELVSNNTAAPRNRLAQYRSLDSGQTFFLVGEISSSSEPQFHQASPIVLPNGETGVIYIAGANTLRFNKIPNTSIRLSSTDWASYSVIIYSGGPNWASLVSNELIDGSLTAWVQDGSIFVLVGEVGSSKIYGFYSDDNGENWNAISQITIGAVAEGVVMDAQYNNAKLTKLAACEMEGRSVLIGHNTNSANIIHFGGYSSIGYPSTLENPTDNSRMKWDHNYIPIYLPGSSAYYTATGAGSDSIGSGGLTLNTSSNIRYYSYTGPAGTYFGEGQVFRFRLGVQTGPTTLSSNYIAFQATEDSGVNSRMINIRFKSTGFDIRDNSGILQSVVWDMTNETEFVIGWYGGVAKISYRFADSKQAKNWTTQTINPGTYATGAGNTVQWGHISFYAGNLISNWQEFHISSGVNAGLNPSIMEPIPTKYPTPGSYLYINEGLSIQVSRGPARGLDQYVITPRADYSINSIFPSVALSPRIAWKSEDDSAAQTIAIFLDQNVAQNEFSNHNSDVYGFHLANINWETANLKRWNGAAWANVGTITTSNGLTSTFSRSGNSIQASTPGKPFYLHYGEAVGWRAILENGGPEFSVKIIQNTEGIWGTNTDAKRAILKFDTGLTDYSTLPTSGNIRLIPDTITVLVESLDDNTGGDSVFQLEIPTQTTLEGYFQIGTMVYGHVGFLAPQYARGRSIEFSPNVMIEETNDGMVYFRKMSNGRRTAQIAWTEPVDTRAIYDLDPDYWQFSTTSGSQPVANYGDAPQMMMGIYQQLNNQEPLVYLPRIPKSTGSSDFQILNRYHDHILARSTGSISIESVLGEELENEMFRIGTVNIVEIE